MGRSDAQSNGQVLESFGSQLAHLAVDVCFGIGELERRRRSRAAQRCVERISLIASQRDPLEE